MPRDTRIDCFFEAMEACMVARESGDEAAIQKAVSEFMERYEALGVDYTALFTELLTVLRDAKSGMACAADEFRRLGDRGMEEAMRQRFPRIEAAALRLTKIMERKE